MNNKLQRYENGLAKLSSHLHARNIELVHLALLGLRAGRTNEDLLGEIISAGGEPQLTEKEVKRAINTANRYFSSPSAGRGVHYSHNGLRMATHTRKAALNELERGFVRKMISIGKGAKSGDFIKLSRGFSGTVPNLEAFLWTIFKPRELVFAGSLYTPRTRENLKSVEELIAEVTRPNAILPTYFVPNPFTGDAGKNSDGNESYCLDSTVAHRRMALIEFDALSLAEQMEFWMGTIRERVLPVRSLVYSGGKSIHGLIELKEDNKTDSVVKWKEQWVIIERLLCSDANSAYRSDSSCKNASRMTRFPEAMRTQTGRKQSLIYLA